MSKVDVAVVEEPLQFASQPNSSLGKSQVADLEEIAVGDDENPEFKLPKTNSLLVVLAMNVLMQVILHFFPTR